MLKLAVANETNDDKVLKFRLEAQEDGTLTLLDEGEKWSVLGLRVVNGKVNFIRYTSIRDKDYNTNEEGQIMEVDED